MDQKSNNCMKPFNLEKQVYTQLSKAIVYLRGLPISYIAILVFVLGSFFLSYYYVSPLLQDLIGSLEKIFASFQDLIQQGKDLIQQGKEINEKLDKLDTAIEKLESSVESLSKTKKKEDQVPELEGSASSVLSAFLSACYYASVALFHVIGVGLEGFFISARETFFWLKEKKPSDFFMAVCTVFVAVLTELTIRFFFQAGEFFGNVKDRFSEIGTYLLRWFSYKEWTTLSNWAPTKHWNFFRTLFSKAAENPPSAPSTVGTPSINPSLLESRIEKVEKNIENLTGKVEQLTTTASGLNRSIEHVEELMIANQTATLNTVNTIEDRVLLQNELAARIVQQEVSGSTQKVITHNRVLGDRVLFHIDRKFLEQKSLLIGLVGDVKQAQIEKILETQDLLSSLSEQQTRILVETNRGVGNVERGVGVVSAGMAESLTSLQRCLTKHSLKMVVRKVNGISEPVLRIVQSLEKGDFYIIPENVESDMTIGYSSQQNQNGAELRLSPDSLKKMKFRFQWIPTSSAMEDASLISESQEESSDSHPLSTLSTQVPPASPAASLQALPSSSSSSRPPFIPCAFEQPSWFSSMIKRFFSVTYCAENSDDEVERILDQSGRVNVTRLANNAPNPVESNASQNTVTQAVAQTQAIQEGGDAQRRATGQELGQEQGQRESNQAQTDAQVQQLQNLEEQQTTQADNVEAQARRRVVDTEQTVRNMIAAARVIQLRDTIYRSPNDLSLWQRLFFMRTEEEQAFLVRQPRTQEAFNRLFPFAVVDPSMQMNDPQTNEASNFQLEDSSELERNEVSNQQAKDVPGSGGNR